MITSWPKPGIAKQRTVVCISTPDNLVQFTHLYEIRTDFINTLQQQYATTSAESLWLRYQPTANVLHDCATTLRQQGVTVIEQFDGSQWFRLRGADVVVFIGHRDNELSKIELYDKSIDVDEFADNFTNLFPKEYNGTIDLHSCYSEDIVNRLKNYFTHRHLLLGTNAPVSVALLAILLPEILRYMRIRNTSYIEAFNAIYQKAIESKQRQERSKHVSGQPTLGRKANCSTVAAPTEAVRGNSFKIQVSLHAERDGDTAIQMFRQRDSQTVERDQTKLAFKLKKNDKVQIRFQIMNNQDSDFGILDSESSSDYTRETVYNGSISTVFFNVSVNRDCRQNSCQCRILLYSKQQELGEMQFTVRIVDSATGSQDQPAAPILVKNFDDYKNESRQRLRQELERLKQKTQLDTESNLSNEKNKQLLKIIDKCLYIIDEYQIDKIANSVFISSTNDLGQERQAVKEALNVVHKTPIMSEYWNAEDITPIDVCCREVLKSDYFVCIIGERYGFVEPNIHLSMTKIEYLVAYCCNMARFIFIHKDLLDKIEHLDKDDLSEQFEFIKEIKQDKFINIYSDAESLKSGTALAILQYEQ